MVESFSSLVRLSWKNFWDKQSPVLAIICITAATQFVQLLTPVLLKEGVPENASDSMQISGAVILTIVLIVSGLASFLTAGAVTSVVYEGTLSLKKALSRGFPVIFDSLVIGLLMFLYSFAWLIIAGGIILVVSGINDNEALVMLGMATMFAGFVCAVIWMPRYAMSIAVYLTEKCTRRQSLDISYAMTNGYWGKIVGNSLLLGLIFFGIMFVVAIVTAFGSAGVSAFNAVIDSSAQTMALAVVPVVMQLILGVLQLFTQYFSLFFNMELYKTIKANPRA